MRVNKLKLNPNKPEVLLARARYDLGFKVSPALAWVSLPLKDRVDKLGVILDPGLLLDKQVTAVAMSAFYQL